MYRKLYVELCLLNYYWPLTNFYYATSMDIMNEYIITQTLKGINACKKGLFGFMFLFLSNLKVFST